MGYRTKCFLTVPYLMVPLCTLLIIASYQQGKKSSCRAHPFDSSATGVFRRAQQIIINNVVDLPCNWSKHTRTIYLCAGMCSTVVREKTKCIFHPRIVHEGFKTLGMYCKPPTDSCLEYNAWLKDSLPLTQQPVRKIPRNLVNNFTLDGLISVDYGVGFVFANYTGRILTWTANFIQKYREQVRAREPFGSYSTDALYPVLDAYKNFAITQKRCAVIGSEYPWIEAALLEYAAASVTTIEYSKILVVKVPGLFAVTPGEFANAQQAGAATNRWDFFDSVWSYSSLEHDGLGRYTDPINPYGDLQTMTKISCMLKPGGFLFLAVPTSLRDEIHFNLHRVYGPVRYPILYRYFHLVQVFAEEIPSTTNYGFQPILVLQNKVGCAN